MKKFMFSAVALVAFSFAGMANTGGEEKINIELINIEIHDKVNVVLAEKADCLDFVADGLEAIDPDNELTNSQAANVANALLAVCYYMTIYN